MKRVYNENTRIAIMKWRAKNKEKYLEYNRPFSLDYYHNHKDKCNQRRQACYNYSKECKRLRAIEL